MILIKSGLAALCVLLAACSTGGGSGDSPSSENAAVAGAIDQCTALRGQVFATPDGNATVTQATLLTATSTRPEHCQVRGTMPPALQFDVRLPTQWNQRLLYVGGGGFDGVIPDAPQIPLQQGYVVVASNGGHSAGPDESWALDPEKLNDYAYRSVHKTLVAARQIVQRRFTRLPTRSYFEGCSNGGREGLISAQRYPNDFDGVVARAPAQNITMLMLAGNRSMQQYFGATGASLSTAKIATLSSAVLAACDRLDNVPDGIISNPSACRFDPATLRCTGADSGSCLTDAQIATANLLYSPFRLRNGFAYYIGWPAGGESDRFGWSAWVANPNDGLPSFSTRFVRYFLTRDATYDPMRFVPDDHLPAIVSAANLLDAASTDYSAFRARNGKLVMWHGTNDWAISYNNSALYYNQVVSAAGGQATADQFVEFFPAPGVQHCFGGAGHDFVDLLTPTVLWVESGIPPSRQNLVATKIDWTQGTLTNNQRPLCKFPQYPRYNGSGDINVASSYTCTSP